MYMENKDIITEKINRLNNIKQSIQTNKGHSNILLFKEFLRRLSYVYELSKVKNEFGLNFYFTEIKEDHNLFENITNFIDSKYHKKFGNGGYFLIHTFLLWEIFKTKIQSLSNIDEEFLDVYEPLIRIFERGGYITKERNIYNVCALKDFKVNQIYITDMPFLIDFSEENLDEIDFLNKSKGTTKASFTYNVVFQKKVNEFIQKNTLTGWSQFYQNFVEKSFVMDEEEYLKYLKSIRCPFGFIGSVSEIKKYFNKIKKLVPKKTEQNLIQTLAVICSRDFLTKRNLTLNEWLQTTKWIHSNTDEQFSIIDTIELFENANNYIKIKIMQMPIFKIF